MSLWGACDLIGSSDYDLIHQQAAVGLHGKLPLSRAYNFAQPSFGPDKYSFHF
jgi:hypothetical protein